ncbi:transmembrane protein 212 [Haliaeetus albicilla]|uniref:transmembrane protein 212 n=1 Tax=Haliaeetus albicilla TaxID=8969 RepID=UPI0037E86E0C
MPGKQLLHAMAMVSKELLFIMNHLCLSFSCDSSSERLTMKVKSLHEVTGGILTTSGIISIFFLEFLLFSLFFSYTPWFFGCSVGLASPIWKELWDAEQKCYQRKDVSDATETLESQLSSLLLGPYCYCSLAGIAGTKYLGYAVLFPFPYVDFPNLCKDPSRYEWSHLTLQILDLFLNLAVFCASLGFGMSFVRLLQFGHLNVSMGQSGEGGLPTVMPLMAARRAAQQDHGP